MEVTRREFLGLSGLIATSVGAVERLVRHRLLGLPAPAEDERLQPRGPERWMPSVCQLCPAGCGVVARIVDHRVVKLEGLPAHPVNRGALCPRGLAGLTELYHPDRLLHPLKRVGGRGEGRWEPIGWDEALRLLVDRLRALRRRGQLDRVAWLSGAPEGMSRQLIRRFLSACGSPHEFAWDPPTGQLPVDAFRAMVDEQGEPLYDLAQAGFLLSFGLDWLQAYPSPVEASRAYGVLRRGRADRRVRMVHVEPRLSVTAAKSDEWIPIRPGQEAWLALGLAHVLIRERSFHEGFVRDHAAGFEEFARFVESQAAIEVAAQRTGISAEAIHRLAREFGLKRGLAVGTRADLVTQWAVMCLNGLVGNLDARGGVLRRWEPPGLALPSDPTRDQDGRVQRIEPAEALPELISSGQSPPVDVLVISHANPCFAGPSPSRWVEALSRLPFIVSVSSYLDETALQADVVLPVPTALEQWQWAAAVASDGSVVANVSQPVTRPRGDTRPIEDVILQLAHALGPPLDAALPWGSWEGLVKARAQALYEAKQGTVLPPIALPGLPAPEGEDPPTSVEGFWELVVKRGGLVWPAEAAPWPEFRTPSGRFEFWPRDVAASLGEPASPLVDVEGSPHAGYPLALHLYTPLAFLNGSGAHLPHLQQIAGSHLQEAWETWAEIHPATAQEAGIRDGDSIWVESRHGKVQAKARWYEGAVPGVVAMPLGLGHTAHGRWAAGIGANPAQLVGPARDRRTGRPLWQGAWVRAWKA